MSVSVLNTLLTILKNIVTGFGDIFTSITTLDVASKVNTSQFSTMSKTLAQFLLVITIVSEAAKLNALDRWEDAFKLAFKLIMCKILISNINNIGAAVYAFFFSNSAAASISAITSSTIGSFLPSYNLTDTGIAGINTIIACIFVLLEIVVVFILMTIILFNLCGIMFEIGMHLVVAPLVVPTLINEHTRSIGISFIKNFAAVCLQLSMIGVMCTVYNALSSSFAQIKSISVSGTSLFEAFLSGLYPILMLVIFSLAISKSSEMTKRMLGA